MNLKRLQKLPLAKRKVIFWTVIIATGLIFLSVFTFTTINRLNNFQINNFKQDINFPSLEIESSSVPPVEIDWGEQINIKEWGDLINEEINEERKQGESTE
jgi:heme/copper-type cytochrome/quinol oxidase subunit 2